MRRGTGAAAATMRPSGIMSVGLCVRDGCGGLAGGGGVVWCGSPGPTARRCAVGGAASGARFTVEGVEGDKLPAVAVGERGELAGDLEIHGQAGHVTGQQRVGLPGGQQLEGLLEAGTLKGGAGLVQVLDPGGDRKSVV